MKVRIKTWEKMEKEFGLDSFGDIKCLFGFNQSMEELLPITRIINISDDFEWYIHMDDLYWISDDMIEEYL